MSGKEALVGTGEAEADLQSVLSERKAGDVSICHPEKVEIGNLDTDIVAWFVWSKQAQLCKALFASWHHFLELMVADL